MPKTIQKWIKRIFSDTHSAIICIIVSGFFVSGGSLYLFCKKLWSDIVQQLQSPTSLWVTSVLVILLGEYIHLKTRLNHSFLYPIKKPIFFVNNNLEWKIEFPDKQANVFSVDIYPYCINHNLRFIKTQQGQYCCPQKIDETCDSDIIDLKKLELIRKSASLYANKKVYESKDLNIKYAKNISGF